MRIAIPTRFQTRYVLLFIAFVFVGQVLEGTDIIFALLTALFNGLWSLAYNVAGGLEYASGVFVFSNGLFSVVLGMTSKVFLLEPGNSHLRSPIKTLFCYCVAMGMMLLVCYFVRALRPRRPLISPIESLDLMRQASISCLFVGLVILAIAGLGVTSNGSIFSALRQIAGFPEMAIILATTYEIRHTNGRRSVNWVTRVSIGIGILYGLVYFGKTGMLGGILLWALTASVQGYNFKKGTLIGLSVAGVFMVYYLVPYSQYVRTQGSTTGSLRQNIPVAIEYLSHLNRTRELYYDSISGVDINEGPHLYDQSEGFLERLVIVGIDDALINYTDQGHIYGLSPVVAAFANLVPRVIWKDKPSLNSGNDFAHELGMLPDEDHTTGIAISITADAYHEASWLGILLALPCSLFVCFIIFDSAAGNARYSPFAMLPIYTLFNAGVSAGIATNIAFATIGLANLIIISWVCKKATPALMNAFRRRSGRPVQMVSNFRNPQTTLGASSGNTDSRNAAV